MKLYDIDISEQQSLADSNQTKGKEDDFDIPVFDKSSFGIRSNYGGFKI
jgi:hypothetical protein